MSDLKIILCVYFIVATFFDFNEGWNTVDERSIDAMTRKQDPQKYFRKGIMKLATAIAILLFA